MKIRMLGTGYGESKIKKRALKDFRGKGGVIIDEKILIDAPADIFDVADELGFSDMFNGICDIIISHSHKGHFSIDSILTLSKHKRVRVFATDSVLSLIPESENIEKIEIFPYITVDLGNYRLLPLAANHETDNPDEICLNFLISSDKTLFYALDGGFINIGAEKFLSETKIDAVILDCALELQDASAALLYHNNLELANVIRKILSKNGSNAKVVLSHIPSDRKHSIHDELSESAEKFNMTVAYDGYFWSI